MKVFIAWLMSADLPLRFHTLSGYEGLRIYPKDAYDERLPEGLPFFRTAVEATKYMAQHPGQEGMCQVSVCCAREMGF